MFHVCCLCIIVLIIVHNIYFFDAPYFSFMYNITMLLLYERTAKLARATVSKVYVQHT